jgi:transposase
LGKGRKRELRKPLEASGGSQPLRWLNVMENGMAHFTLEKAVEVPDEPETVIAIDRSEYNLAVAVAISKSKPNKPMP